MRPSFLKYNRYAATRTVRLAYRLQVLETWVWNDPRERERGRNEKNNGPTRLREPAHDAINHRPSRRISFTLGTRPIRGQFGFAEKGNDSMTKASFSFFLLRNQSSRKASPNEGLATYFVCPTVVISVFRLSLSLFAKVIVHPDVPFFTTNEPSSTFFLLLFLPRRRHTSSPPPQAPPIRKEHELSLSCLITRVLMDRSSSSSSRHKVISEFN